MILSLSRRKFTIEAARRAGALLTILLVVSNCRERKVEDRQGEASGDTQNPCGDLSGVAENDLELRRKFAYVKESPIADSHCNNCNLYLPPKADSVFGSCLLFKGPVEPSGYCTYWAPKVG